MTAKQYKSKTRKLMSAVGTWHKSFEPAVDTLSALLEKRDEAYQAFLDSGGEACVEYTSDRGSVNVKKNPRLQIWLDLNAQALAYWRDMGLTPAGLKKLNEAALKPEKAGSPLEEALKSFGGGEA